MESKEIEFNKLVAKVKICERCVRMCHRKKVLSNENGNINSKVIFIAEAPGRLGAEKTGKPLFGDKTGENFDYLLNSIGWRRENIFITNAILCNPQKLNCSNSTPSDEETGNCSSYLKKTLELVNPDIIVTLGKHALNALKLIQPHKFILKTCVAKKIPWNDKYLFPLYHMSPKAINFHRNMNKQKEDFIELSKLVDSLN